MLWATCVSRPTFARQIPSLAVESLQVSDITLPPQPSPSVACSLLAVAIGVGSQQWCESRTGSAAVDAA
eukprot:11568561-Alexandrium_andersonii.AAC.1